MRANDEKLNSEEDRKQVIRPVIAAVLVFTLLSACFVWLAVKQPNALISLRDLLVTLVIFILFVLGIILTIVFIILAGRVGGARTQIDQVLSTADGKIEELADKVTDLLRAILNPFLEMKSRSAGLLHILSRKKSGD